MISLTSIGAMMSLLVIGERAHGIIVLALWVTGFLLLLNVVLAILYRGRRKREVVSYYAVGAIELSVFVFALLIHVGVIQQVPFHLPSGLPVNRAEIGAALAFGIGLFPAAYWHRINVSELPKRIAEDAVLLKKRDGGVHVPPGEWMN